MECVSAIDACEKLRFVLPEQYGKSFQIHEECAGETLFAGLFLTGSSRQQVFPIILYNCAETKCRDKMSPFSGNWYEFSFDQGC